MKVTMKPELWEAVIVAIDNDLDDYHSIGTEGDPELDIRYGKMLQARGEILCEKQDRYVENKDLKILLDFMLDYGGMGSLPNMDEGESGDLAYEAAARLAKDNEPELLTYWINTHEKCRTGRAKSKGINDAKV
jgi:hypothetical protein